MASTLIHITSEPISDIILIQQRNEYTFKPRGLWYSPVDVWIKWTKRNFPKEARLTLREFYAYQLTLSYTDIKTPNPEKVLRINNSRDFDAFNFKYGWERNFPPDKDGDEDKLWLLISWAKVANDYAGIEIIPHLKLRLNQLTCEARKRPEKCNQKILDKYRKQGFKLISSITWYDTFDVASGCIWNPSAVLELKLAYHHIPIPKAALIHISKEPITEITTVKQKDESGFKPSGLWYSPTSTWMKWARQNLSGYDDQYYAYILVVAYTTIDDPDPKRVLRIQNHRDFDQFNFKYAQEFKDKENPRRNSLLINWTAVASDFGGIEIIPQQKKRLEQLSCHEFGDKNTCDVKILRKYHRNGFKLRWKLIWYDGFDVASGCIWNRDAILEWKFVDRKNLDPF